VLVDHRLGDLRAGRHLPDAGGVEATPGDPLPQLAPGSDHCWDAVRYSLSPIIRGRGGVFVVGGARRKFNR